jgi:hypothetical protein
MVATGLFVVAAMTAVAVAVYAVSVYREAAASDKYDPRTSARLSHPKK